MHANIWALTCDEPGQGPGGQKPRSCNTCRELSMLTYTHKPENMHTHTPTYTKIYVNVFAHAHTHTHTQTHRHTHTFTHARKHERTHAFTHRYTRTQTTVDIKMHNPVTHPRSHSLNSWFANYTYDSWVRVYTGTGTGTGMHRRWPTQTLAFKLAYTHEYASTYNSHSMSPCFFRYTYTYTHTHTHTVHNGQRGGDRPIRLSARQSDTHADR